MDTISKAERNYQIAAAQLAGEPLTEIAARFGISKSHVANIVSQNAELVEQRDGRPLPDGLTTRAALAIESVLGIWPTADDKKFVESKAMTILRSPVGRRIIMVEIGSWLEYKVGSRNPREVMKEALSAPRDRLGRRTT